MPLPEDPQKPSDGVRACSLVRIVPTEANSNAGRLSCGAAAPEKKLPLGKKYLLLIGTSALWRKDVVNSRELWERDSMRHQKKYPDGYPATLRPIMVGMDPAVCLLDAW